MVFLFPDSSFLKYRQGHTLYDRLPQARALWKKAEELTGEKVLAFSFGTPTEELKPGPVARLSAFLHALSSAEALIRSRKAPLEVSGFGTGLLAAAAVALLLKPEEAMLWAYSGRLPDKVSLDSPRYALRSPMDPALLLNEGNAKGLLEGYDLSESANREAETRSLLGFWKGAKVQSIVVPGPGQALAGQLRKLEPGIQSLPAAELEDIATIMKVTR